MLKKSYAAIAGGYARRLYMVSNNIDMTKKDMDEYFTSDMDFFMFSANLVERTKVTFDPFEASLGSSATFQNITANTIKSYNVSIYTGEKDNTSHYLKFKPLKSLLKKNENIKDVDRPYMFYKNSLMCQTCFKGVNLFNIKDVSDLGVARPEIQFIKASKSKLKTMEGNSNKAYAPKCRYSMVLVDTFDLSQTKFYIESMDYDTENCKVVPYGANTDDVYNCDVSSHIMNNVNMFIRIKKYAALGMKFDKDQISKLLEAGSKRMMSTSIIEGGYY